jgi:hypothetical protein
MARQTYLVYTWLRVWDTTAQERMALAPGSDATSSSGITTILMYRQPEASIADSSGLKTILGPRIGDRPSSGAPPPSDKAIPKSFLMMPLQRF